MASSLVPRPSTPPVFDRLQYAKTDGEGLGELQTLEVWADTKSCRDISF